MALYKCAGRHRGYCEYESTTPWKGRCPGCGRFYNCDKLGVDSAEQKGISSFASAVRTKQDYISTGLEGVDKVLGGGLVAGKVVLLGGFPGAGKSTLLTCLAESIARKKGKTLYASGEEDDDSVIAIAHRVGLVLDDAKVLGNQRSVEKVLETSKELRAFLTIFDSAQKFASDFAGGAPGSLSQCKAIGETIAKHCRETKTCAIIVNQMSKDGDLKGGTELEHHCDVVMVLAYPKEDDEEAPPGDKIRMLVNSKNRVGPENLKTYWRMIDETEDGRRGVLEHIPPRSKIVDLGSRRGRYRRD